jgi:hypothetical protein
MLTHHGLNGTDVRPPRKASGRKQWAKDPSGAGARDGTVIDATFLNDVKGLLVGLCDAYGISLTEGDDTLLAQAVAAAFVVNFEDAALTGTPTAPTADPGTNTTQIATTEFVLAAVAALVDSSPTALNTLNELAAALGDDANFATTVTNALAAKAPLASPALTGNPTAPTQTQADNSTKIATTAYVDTAKAAAIAAAVAAVSGAVSAAYDTLAEVETALGNLSTNKANLNSPALTGTPTAPTPTAADNSTKIATTAYVDAAVAAVGGAGTLKRRAIADITGGGTIQLTDKGHQIDIASGTGTLAFDPVATLGDGHSCIVRNLGTGDVTLNPDGAETIDGLANWILYPGGCILVQCDGSALRSTLLTPMRKRFTASGTFTKPGCGTIARIHLVAGGGAGGRAANTTNHVAFGGGGGEGILIDLPLSSLGTTESVTVGTGAPAQTVNSTPGADGNDSTFGSLLTARGGKGGGAQLANTADGAWLGGMGGDANDVTANVFATMASANLAMSLASRYQSGHGGGSLSVSSSVSGVVRAGSSVIGGGGGGSRTVQGPTNGTEGKSTIGGNGGVAPGGAGTVPGGGGAGHVNTNSGAGADGWCDITIH